MIYGLIICLVIIGFLGYKLYQKQKIDKSELEKYTKELNLVKDAAQSWQVELSCAKEKTEYEKCKLEECRKDLQAALDVYNDITENKLKELDIQIEEQRRKRQDDLDKNLKETKQKYELIVEAVERDCQNKTEKYFQEVDAQKVTAENAITYYKTCVDELKTQYEALLEPIKLYEKQKQEKLFYTIQLADEYKDDIEFLLTTVAAKVQHPDIISKLVWAEYVKPNLDETFKRIEIKPESGIYKLTSLENGKSYIGKSTNVKNRIQDHFKSSIGIKSIADQAVHHAILKEGFWNWSIEIVTYADKDRLNELEKYYIEFFKTQEYGYNKNSGGGG